ncbi:inosine-uridine nucleoside N-ribohydrolase [Nitrospirillum amazonense]|uniref:Inosine-uridine nucleoside N-ribohydrolase n=1 Tax=Nitrospirillum amazonense TaxID=28077 RepID=A0A560JHF5_9PROT|nr:nucleoside hydrolase [Nitrospirillum amazonense]TWB68794.1 inosine-uridine nucleoside N-ribohydrolase [Nitrospirillum amazonense]
MNRLSRIAFLFLRLCAGVFCFVPLAGSGLAASTAATPAREKVIIDTDIGDDIDDAFALAAALNDPRLDILGVTAAWGDTGLRVRQLQRLLAIAGRGDIPVAQGPATPNTTPYTQKRWAEGQPAPASPVPSSVDFILEQARRYPGQVTLISLAPPSTLGALIDRDPAGFAKLKRVVMMGGSVYAGYDDTGYGPLKGPTPEYNIYSDIGSAKKLFTSGVPLVVMPLDSTRLKLDEVKRDLLFAAGTPMTDALALMYHQWRHLNGWGQITPTLFDLVPVAYVLDPRLCPTTPLRLVVGDKGETTPAPGPANAQVCLKEDKEGILDLLMTGLLARQ